MPEKKPYESPKIFRVELNQELAILASCSSSELANPDSATTSCRATDCRRSRKGGGDNAAPPS